MSQVTAREWAAANFAYMMRFSMQTAASDALDAYDRYHSIAANSQLVCDFVQDPDCPCSGEAFSCDCSSRIDGAWGGVCTKCRSPMIRIDCNTGARLTLEGLRVALWCYKGTLLSSLRRRSATKATQTGQELSAVPRYYIIDTRTIVGNCALFWCPKGNGYTTQLEEAGLFTKEETHSHRETDLAVPEAWLRQHAVSHVRVDRLRDVLTQIHLQWPAWGP